MTTMMTPDEVLTTTRSVRRRLDLDRPVSLDLVRECLTVALQAPTGGDRQGWHFVVVTDPAVKERIGAHYRRSFADHLATQTPPDDPVLAARQTRLHDVGARLAERMGRVPVLVLPCISTPSGTDELPAGSQAGLWGSILPAAWSYMLAARARGLGTAWTTLHLRYEREIADLLGLPVGVRQAALLPTAHYTGDGFRPANRRPLDEVLHVDSW